ncbi:MAG: hypothetical protein V4598_09500 [Bdellovibrionota bacterium]
MKITAMLFVLISFSAHALDLDVITRTLNTPPIPQIDCFDPRETPVCGDINRQFCRNLSTNGLTATDSTGVINVGKSQRSQISEIERANLVDTTRILPALPEDLRRELTRPIARLTQLVQTENDSRNWYRDVSRARADIAEKVRSVANRRADASLRTRLPRGQRATDADKTAERDRQFRGLMDTVSNAKMTSSPTWPRINNVFAKVKEDMLAVINTLPLTPEEKQQRIEKINTTNLSTPFGLRMGGVLGQIMEDDCRTNMVNALYLDLTNSLTICQGLANGFQSENSLYFTLAHELAHSFNLKFLQDENSTPRWGRLNERLVSSNGNMPCEEYARLTEQSRNENDIQCGRNEYNTFMNCVSGQNPEQVLSPVMGQAQAAQLFNVANFCSILDQKQGLAFMNPNEFADRNFGRIVSSVLQEFSGATPPNGRELLSPAYHIVQETRCNTTTPCSTTALSAQLRMGLNPPAVCNVIAERGAENEADWYAQKAMIIRLRTMTDIRARRELVAGSMGLFCGETYRRPLSEDDQKKLEEEILKIAAGGGFGDDHHASNADRQNSIMTEDMASLLQCTRPESTEATSGYQSCRL